jgi:hypothetical protein
MKRWGTSGFHYSGKRVTNMREVARILKSILCSALSALRFVVVPCV